MWISVLRRLHPKRRSIGRCGGWRRRGSPPPAFRAWYLAFEARRNDHAPGWARQFLSSPSAGLCSCPNNERARPWMSSRVRIGGRPGGEASRSSSLATHQIRNGAQPENRECAGVHHTKYDTAARRRGNRIAVLAHVHLLHLLTTGFGTQEASKTCSLTSVD